MLEAPSKQIMLAKLGLMLREQGVENQEILAAIEAIPAKLFFSSDLQQDIFEDTPMVIGCGQTSLTISDTARMIALLSIKDTNSVLEIGTGSGYTTAILSKLAAKVITIERQKKLADLARHKFSYLDLRNIIAYHEDGLEGYPPKSPYHRILVNVSVPSPPAQLLEQLAVGGIMVAPVGPPGELQQLCRYTRRRQEIHFEYVCQMYAVSATPGKAYGD